MTTYWCSWCGETAEAETADERIQCMRCVREFWKLFGFWPEAAMTPLADEQEPGVPESARKRFTFVHAETGKEIGRTQVARVRKKPRRAG